MFETVKVLSLVQIEGAKDVDEFDEQNAANRTQDLEATHPAASGIADTMASTEDENPGNEEPFKRKAPKVGRNDPCTCGSGKKYKQCCGKLT
jgi:preprotein translocase subunit SecA